MSNDQSLTVPDYSVSEVLSCYSLSDQHRATLEVASLTDTPEALEELEPGLQEACRALRQEANAEAEFNERYNTKL